MQVNFIITWRQKLAEKPPLPAVIVIHCDAVLTPNEQTNRRARGVKVGAGRSEERLFLPDCGHLPRTNFTQKGRRGQKLRRKEQQVELLTLIVFVKPLLASLHNTYQYRSSCFASGSAFLRVTYDESIFLLFC